MGNIGCNTLPRYQDIFIPGDDDAYRLWRKQKLADGAQGSQSKLVCFDHLHQPGQTALCRILAQCEAHNFAIYQVSDPGPEKQLRRSLIEFCHSLGLNRAETNRSQGDDGIVSIQVEKQAIGAGYIPYSDKSLSWHSDGYYNAPTKRIKGMVLHCVRDASEGGVNEFLDHEIVYLRLRDANPAYVSALMHDQAMTIPENTDQRSAYRPPSIGPVFFCDAISGRLQMRYSARSRNIIWRDDDLTTRARAMLKEIMADDPMIVRHKLRPGQGIISNNVLHNRTGFSNGAEQSSSSRLLYRIRYLDAVRTPNSNAREESQCTN